MKRFLIALLLLVALHSPAFTQTGHISLYSDPAGTSCQLTDILGLVTVYVFHHATPGVTASAFAVEEGTGFNMLYLASVWNSGVIIGNDPRNGVAISYGGCFASPIALGQILYFGQGVSSACSTIRVVNHPDYDCIGAVLCTGTDLLAATGGVIYINNDGSCFCHVANAELQTAQPRICIPVPVEEATWGSIKALYE